MQPVSSFSSNYLNKDYNPLITFQSASKKKIVTKKGTQSETTSVEIFKDEGTMNFSYILKEVHIPLPNTVINEKNEIESHFLNMKAEYDHLLALSNHQNSIKPISFECNYHANQRDLEFIFKLEDGGIDMTARFNQLAVQKESDKIDDLLIRWAKQSVSILAFAQQLGIRHGDIKNSNMTIDQNDNLHLIDLGSARDYLKRLKNQNTVTQTNNNQSQNTKIDKTPEYVAPEILKSDVSHPFLSDVYSWAISFYILLRGPKKLILLSNPNEPPHQIDDLKTDPNDHEVIVKAVDECVFYGANSQILKRKFLPIIKACLNFNPKKRMNFLQLNSIFKKFDNLNEEQIKAFVNTYSNDENKVIRLNPNEDFFELELVNNRLTEQLKEKSNETNESEKAWNSILKTFAENKINGVNVENVSKILSELFSLSNTKDEKLVKKDIEYNNLQEEKMKLKNQMKAVFDLLNQIVCSHNIQDIFKFIKRNKEAFLDSISQEHALDNIEIPKETVSDINIRKQGVVEEKKQDEHNIQGGLDLVQLICSKVFVYKHIFISRFAQVNARIESPFFRKSREDYECPFCKKCHKSHQLKSTLGGDIATLERETIKALEKLPNLKLGKCTACECEIKDKEELFITDCGHFYHLVCMLKKFVLSRLEELKCSARDCNCRINKENIYKYYEKDLYEHKMFNCSLCFGPIENKDDLGIMNCMHTFHLDCIVTNQIEHCHICFSEAEKKKKKENYYAEITEEEAKKFDNLEIYQKALIQKGCMKCKEVSPKFVTSECKHSICAKCISSPRFYESWNGFDDHLLYIDDQKQTVECLCDVCDPSTEKKFKIKEFYISCGCPVTDYFNFRKQLLSGLKLEHYKSFPFQYPKCPTGKHELADAEMHLFMGPKNYNQLYESSYNFIIGCRDFTSKDYSNFRCKNCGRNEHLQLFSCNCVNNEFCPECLRDDKIKTYYYSTKCPQCKTGVPTNKFIKLCYALKESILYLNDKSKFDFINDWIILSTKCCNNKGIKSQEHPNQFYCFECEYTLSPKNGKSIYD